MDFFRQVVRLLIQCCRSVAWVDFREGCGRVMHMLENVRVGHGGEELDIREVWIRNLDRSGRWGTYGMCCTGWWHFILGDAILCHWRDRS